MTALHVKVVIDTDQLHRWATKHRELGHQSVDTLLTTAARHYESIGDDSLDGEGPPAPAYPPGLDSVEIQHWADWHIDHGPAGVAHILVLAAENATTATADANRDEARDE